MRRLSQGAAGAVLAGAVLLLGGAAAHPQAKKQTVDLKVVKWAGLAAEVAGHQGKVVLVDFWFLS